MFIGLFWGFSRYSLVWIPFVGTEPLCFLLCKGPRELFFLEFYTSLWCEGTPHGTWPQRGAKVTLLFGFVPLPSGSRTPLSSTPTSCFHCFSPCRIPYNCPDSTSSTMEKLLFAMAKLTNVSSSLEAQPFPYQEPSESQGATLLLAPSYVMSYPCQSLERVPDLDHQPPIGVIHQCIHIHMTRLSQQVVGSYQRQFTMGIVPPR